MSLLAGTSAPASTITTTSETVAANIPALPIQPPAGGANPSWQQQGLDIRGNISIATGTGTTAIAVKLRVGQNNTTTAQVDLTEQKVSAASATDDIAFEFNDVNVSDLNSGFTITISQVGATGNGTINQVEYSVDIALP